jgi:hypothetical protein
MLPEKLARDIAEEEVQWDGAQICSISEFLARYTLHDSHWIGMHVDAAWEGDATAIICFDPHWNKIDVQDSSNCDEWPILLIRFTAITSINMTGYRDVGGVQRGIGIAEAIDTDKGLVQTVISDHYGGEIEIMHRDPVRVLCYTANGDRIELQS